MGCGVSIGISEKVRNLDLKKWASFVKNGQEKKGLLKN